jgi:DNA-3-methyladenine glycosylase
VGGANGAAAGPGREFFDRPADQVAPGLLGWVLEHETADGLVAVELTEVEAYLGAIDPASHSYRGPTARNGVMFGPPGYAYVYFTYGMHFCVNVTCQPPGTATAVLLRAGRIVVGEQLARRRRAARRPPAPGRLPDPAADEASDQASAATALSYRDLARGPARLCVALAIDRTQNGLDLFDPASPLRLRPPDAAFPGTTAHPGTTAVSGTAAPAISTGPRVGITMAAEVPWRFWLTGDPTVSPYRPGKRRSR